MLRALFIAVVALLLFDASGAFALVSPESCMSLTESAPDGACPALCVRCSCAQPAMPDAAPAMIAEPIRSFAVTTPVSQVTEGSPRSIFHVPK